MKEYSLDAFMEVLCSKAPVPGGGGVAAVGGALGASLGSMVCELTVGKKKYAEYEEELQEILKRAVSLKECLLELVEEDAVAFEPLSRAYGLPKNTPEELATREAVMEAALDEASRVPMAICEVACDVIELHERLSVIGSRMVISDVGVGVVFAKAALQSGALNVRINTRMMKNRERAEKYQANVDAMLKKYVPMADAVYEEVCKALV